MEEDDEGSKFCEEDIDQILLRRTTTITIESEGKGSTFAKVPVGSLTGSGRLALERQKAWFFSNWVFQHFCKMKRAGGLEEGEYWGWATGS